MKIHCLLHGHVQQSTNIVNRGKVYAIEQSCRNCGKHIHTYHIYNPHVVRSARGNITHINNK